jgi:hypothetical protein
MTHASAATAVVFFALVGQSLFCANARAEDSAGGFRSAELGLGGQIGFGSGSICNSNGIDVVACSAGAGFAGLSITPQWRFSRFVSTGVVGAISWGIGSATLWQVTAQLRLRPFGTGGPGFWFGPDAGVVVLVDEIQDGSIKSKSRATTAPTLGATAGVALLARETYEVGVDLRGFVNLFESRDEVLPKNTAYETQAGAALSVSLAMLF